ncbi:MAG: hypothetical protein J2P56_08915 [Verrucomicrobia bacterium]|nr:hypothetical protein [Verrucomicrobiota bacterium]
MKRRWHHWAFGIFVGLMAIVFVGVPASIALLFVYGFAPSYPPSIVRDQLKGAGLRNKHEVSRKLTALLRRKFPTGTSEGALKSTLLNQGFKPPPQPPADCVPPDDRGVVRRSYNICPPYDPGKALLYSWGNFPCGQTLVVRWSTTTATRSHT